MRRRHKLVGAAIGVVFVVGVAGLLITLRYGFSTHDEPTRIEAITARSIRHWSVPADLRDVRNPVPLTATVLALGRSHFADHCASCHGNDGKGKTELGEHLYPRVPDMTLGETQKLSDGELFSVIENGIRLTGMPGWGEGTASSGYGTWTLVHFIRRLPQITTEELDEMSRLNPKTPEEWEQAQAEQEFLEGAPERANAVETAPSNHHH